MTSQAAPGDLEILRGFVNTLDIESGQDDLAEVEDAGAWLRDHGLLAAGELRDDDLTIDEIREVREAFRDLLHASAHGEDAPDARVLLNDTAERAGLRVNLTGPDEVGFAIGERGLIAGLARLVSIAVDAMREGTWQRLKVCDNDGCAWAFYDHSRNRSGRWCSMAVCGNRMKVRAYRERERDG